MGPRWSMALRVPPRIERMGASMHGLRPTERFHIAGLWSIHLYRYRGELCVIDTGEVFPIRPGHAGITPPDTDVEYRFDEHAIHVWAHVHLPDPGVAAADDTRREPVPAMVDLGSTFGTWWSAFDRALASWYREPAYAAAMLWHLTWAIHDAPGDQIAGTGRGASPAFPYGDHPALGDALQIIETRLADPLRVAGVAAEVGISHNQLTRLFREATGLTPLAYLRARRVEQATYLLTRSTRPIKSIAAEVGIPDLQAFNKVIRSATGRSPRALRAGH